MLLAAVSALSLHNIAGGQEVPPAAMADLLRAQELKEQLDKCETVGSSYVSFCWVIMCVWGCG